MKWEYLVEERQGWDPFLSKTLTYYGFDGWELVTVLPANASNLIGSMVRLIFKRPAVLVTETAPPARDEKDGIRE